MNIEKAIDDNKEARLYCIGKSPRVIKATKEFLQSWVDNEYTTISELAEKYGCHTRSISKHAHILADILRIPRSGFHQKPTFHRYPQFPTRLSIKCPKCKHEFDVSYTGRILNNEK